MRQYELNEDGYGATPGSKTVCFFFGNFSGFGGAERSAISIANGLAESGFNVLLLSLASTGAPFFAVDERVKMISLFEKKISFKKNFFEVLRLVRKISHREGVDVWIDVDPVMCIFSRAALFTRKIKCIAWEHFNMMNDLGLRERRLGRWLAANFSDAVVVLTRQDEKMWLDRLRPRARMEVIYNPCPFEIVGKKNQEDSGNIILSVGRLIDLKGYDQLINAWKIICVDEMTLADWKLVIVGDGPEERRLKNLAGQLDIADSIVFTGKQSDVERYYRRADVYCLSSRAEGLPMVLIEAQAYGLPIVAFDCLTGPAEIVEEGKSGYLVKPGDIHELAQALRSLMKDRNLRMNMSSASLVAAGRFDRKRIIKQWCALLTGTGLQ